MPFIDTTSGVRLHYREKGEGRPLVLLHGWSSSAAVWHFQEQLVYRCRLISVDLRGHGDSSAPPVGYGLADLAGDLVELFIELDLHEALLLGWSLGAQLAMAVFPQLRERLSGLILVGATPRFTLAADWSYGVPASEPRWIAKGLKRNYEQTLGDFFRSMFAPGELSRAEENRIAREIVMPGKLPEPAVAIATLDILATADLRNGLAGIDRPVLIIHGAADTICLAGAASYMAEQLPFADLHILAGLGHAPFLSRPDEFNKLLENFLQVSHGRY